jgi:hypothetical protein
MRNLLSFSLAALATLSVAGCATTAYTVVQESGGRDCRRLAQPGDTKIRIYCAHTVWSDTRHQPARASATSQPQTSGDSTCRWVAKPTDTRIRNICGDTAQWDQFDSEAITAGVTCRWTPFRRKTQPEELCLNVAQWRGLDSGPARAASATGNVWPTNDSLATNAPGNQIGGGGPYGYFPAGTSIGATTPAGPPGTRVP